MPGPLGFYLTLQVGLGVENGGGGTGDISIFSHLSLPRPQHTLHFVLRHAALRGITLGFGEQKSPSGFTTLQAEPAVDLTSSGWCRN